MLTLTQQREQAAAAARVMGYLRRHRLDPDDLVRFGGEDLADPNPQVRETARAVERGWALLAALNLNFKSFIAVVAPQEEGGTRCKGAGHNLQLGHM